MKRTVFATVVIAAVAPASFSQAAFFTANTALYQYESGIQGDPGTDVDTQSSVSTGLVSLASTASVASLSTSGSASTTFPAAGDLITSAGSATLSADQPEDDVSLLYTNLLHEHVFTLAQPAHYDLTGSVTASSSSEVGQFWSGLPLKLINTITADVPFDIFVTDSISLNAPVALAASGELPAGTYKLTWNPFVSNVLEMTHNGAEGSADVNYSFDLAFSATQLPEPGTAMCLLPVATGALLMRRNNRGRA